MKSLRRSWKSCELLEPLGLWSGELDAVAAAARAVVAAVDRGQVEVQAGDVVHQRPGIVHYLFDYSPDMEYLEIVSPADFKTVDMPPATDKVPPVTPWK